MLKQEHGHCLVSASSVAVCFLSLCSLGTDFYYGFNTYKTFCLAGVKAQYKTNFHRQINLICLCVIMAFFGIISLFGCLGIIKKGGKKTIY